MKTTSILVKALVLSLMLLAAATPKIPIPERQRRQTKQHSNLTVF
jgi:hypothetical protein